jgi:hypothetical protein
MSKHRRQQHPREPERASGLAALQPWKQDAIAILALYVLTLIVFRAIVFDGAAFAEAGDTAAAVAYEQVAKRIQAEDGITDVLWAPYFFSGMPTFGNFAIVPRVVSYAQQALVWVLDFFFLKGPWTWLVVFYFLSGVFMYAAARELGFRRPVAFFAAIVYMLGPYGVGLAGEGHGSKLMALTYLPLVFLFTHRLFERRDLLSLGLLAASVGTLMLANHAQIAYYVFMLVGLFIIYRLILDARTHTREVLTATGMFAAALAIGLAISAYNYLSAYEYAQYSIRGGGTEGAAGGLAYEYATNWSWHPAELLTLFVPGFFGFRLPYYWGMMEPWTDSTVYVGLLPVLFAVVAFSIRRTAMTWFFLAATVIVILLSFGRNFPLVYETAFSVLPFFDKFRAPAMILQLLRFTLAVLGAVGLQAILDLRNADQSRMRASMLAAARVTLLAGAALAAVLLLLKPTLAEILSGTWFLKAGELEQYRQQYGQQAGQVVAQLKQLRFTTFWNDAVSFALLLACTAGIVWLYLKETIRPALALALLVGVTLVDLFLVDNRLIQPRPAAAITQSFPQDETITFLQDRGRGSEEPFRVFPLGALFGEKTYAYHGIQSIGGYSPAKLKIYQTLLDSCLYRGSNPAFPLNMNVVDMLNVRYLVVPGRLPEGMFPVAHMDGAQRSITYENPTAMPRAVLVGGAVAATTDRETYSILNSPSFNPRTTAVIQGTIPTDIAPPAPGDGVRVTKYGAHRIVLESRASAPALLVLSEIYYPAGWKAAIDGADTEILRTNSVLRSVRVPAGTHTIEFTFAPPLYWAGLTITNVAWLVALLCVISGLWRIPQVRDRLARRSQRPAAGS